MVELRPGEKSGSLAQNFIGALQLFIVSFELLNTLGLTGSNPIIGQICLKLLNPRTQSFGRTAELAGNGNNGRSLSGIFTALLLVKMNCALTDFR